MLIRLKMYVLVDHIVVWGKVMFSHMFVTLSTGVRIQWGWADLPPSDTTEYGKRAGGTHPTGKHSCSYYSFLHYHLFSDYFYQKRIWFFSEVWSYVILLNILQCKKDTTETGAAARRRESWYRQRIPVKLKQKITCPLTKWPWIYKVQKNWHTLNFSIRICHSHRMFVLRSIIQEMKRTRKCIP